MASQPAAAPSASPSVAEQETGADLSFSAMMAEHHAGGVMLAGLAAQKATLPALKALGAEMMQEQAGQQPQLAAIAERLGGSPATPPASVQAFNEMTMKTLMALTGPEFDKAFLDAFRGHHAQAIAMSAIEVAGGTDPDALALASTIVASQTMQLAQMNELRTQLG